MGSEMCIRDRFVKDCIAYTAAQHTDPMHGVQFEKLLPRLFSCHENWTEV